MAGSFTLGTDTSVPNVLTETGRPLRTLAAGSTVLLVFLRHWGCPFCRQTLSDIAELRSTIEAKGVLPVFVHMGTPERGRPYFEHYGLSSVERISDPEQALYRDPMFALRNKPVLSHAFDRAAIRSFFQGITFRHGISLMHREDAGQMPGVFLLRDGVVVSSFRYRSIADKPDFLRMIR